MVLAWKFTRVSGERTEEGCRRAHGKWALKAWEFAEYESASVIGITVVFEAQVAIIHAGFIHVVPIQYMPVVRGTSTNIGRDEMLEVGDISKLQKRSLSVWCVGM